MRLLENVFKKGASRRGAFLFLLLTVLVLPACASQDKGVIEEARAEELAPATTAAQPAPQPEEAATVPAPEPTQAGEAAPAAPTESQSLAPQWQDLQRRLAAKGLKGPEVDALLTTLGPRTPSPMGRKMLELYRRDFMPRSARPKTPSGAVYKGVVTEANATLCRNFIAGNQEAFDRAYERYGVPPSVAASLLFVETRLGTVLKDVPENALQTLTSMAESRDKSDIAPYLGKMPGHEKHDDWFRSTMARRADWALNETKALIAYMIANNVQPEDLPGSIYGAIGLCQFMPSNIVPYGVDGNGDGVINLYDADDAVASLANYLAKHGWKRGQDRAARHKTLLRYNKSVRYANTILALADVVDGKASPEAATQAAAKTKAAPKAKPRPLMETGGTPKVQ